jgi:hypothetical protein
LNMNLNMRFRFMRFGSGSNLGFGTKKWGNGNTHSKIILHLVLYQKPIIKGHRYEERGEEGGVVTREVRNVGRRVLLVAVTWK